MTAYALGFAMLFVFLTLLIVMALCLIAMEGVVLDKPPTTTTRLQAVTLSTDDSRPE